MIKPAIIDANEWSATSARDKPRWAGVVSAVVPSWIAHECRQAGVKIYPPAEADVIFVCHAGAIAWRKTVSSCLRYHGIDPSRTSRRRRPLVIAGGQIAKAPITATRIADLVCVGEAYNAVRSILQAKSADDVYQWGSSAPHAYTADQVASIPRMVARPWLFVEPPPRLASPDPYVDWSAPPVLSPDGVVRVIASKGCHKKCAFCATTYDQTYRRHADPAAAIAAIRAAAKTNHVQAVSNDPANLPWWDKAVPHLYHGSFTIDELRRPGALRHLQKPGAIKNIRLGVEGVSERLRRAVGKRIDDDEIIDILEQLHAAHKNTTLFFVRGLPGETDDDWASLRSLYRRARSVVTWGISRWKFTSFCPDPPAPLCANMPSPSDERIDGFVHWLSHSGHMTSHILIVPGYKTKAARRVIADLVGCHHQELPDHGQPLAADVDDFARMHHQLVDWPLSPETRWKVASTYMRRVS